MMSRLLRFQDRLMRLGFSSYDDYLASPHWRKFKDDYRQAGMSMRCAVCDCTPIQLHHHNYENLGAELLADVDPLCPDHHKAVHVLLKDGNRYVKDTAWAIKTLRDQQPKKQNIQRAPSAPTISARKKKHLERQAQQQAAAKQRRELKRQKAIALEAEKQAAAKKRREASKAIPKVLVAKIEKPLGKNIFNKSKGQLKRERKLQSLAAKKVKKPVLKIRPKGNVRWDDPSEAMRAVAAGVRP